VNVRCPACGFASAPGAKWCEFCKEPFREKKPVAPGALPLDPKVIEEKLAADWAAQPAVSWSPRTRAIAIGFLAFTLLAAMGTAALLMVQTRSNAAPGAQTPPGVSIPRRE
jgi:hypothetical protein